jgi:hypothetical protein
LVLAISTIAAVALARAMFLAILQSMPSIDRADTN